MIGSELFNEIEDAFEAWIKLTKGLRVEIKDLTAQKILLLASNFASLQKNVDHFLILLQIFSKRILDQELLPNIKDIVEKALSDDGVEIELNLDHGKVNDKVFFLIIGVKNIKSSSQFSADNVIGLSQSILNLLRQKGLNVSITNVFNTRDRMELWSSDKNTFALYFNFSISLASEGLNKDPMNAVGGG